MTSLTQLRSDYREWHHIQVSTDDIDPVYPLLRYAADYLHLSWDEMLWSTFLHVAWYHPGSTLLALDYWPDPTSEIPDAVMELPCGTERRGHRSKVNLRKHLEALQALFREAPPSVYVSRLSDAALIDPRAAWKLANAMLVEITGNGRWAAYKNAEMLQKVCGIDLEATDAGHAFSSGPRRGLELLTRDCPTGNTSADVEILDRYTEALAEWIGEEDLALVETSLCDFNSMVRGRYYTGHDIDSMLSAFQAVDVPGWAWTARRACFAHELLGEQNDWEGVRKSLNRRYKETGEYK